MTTPTRARRPARSPRRSARPTLLLSALLLGMLPDGAAAQTRTFAIDADHSTIGFAVAVFGGLSEVRGEFTGVDGTIRYDPADPARSSVRVDIDAATIDTGNDQRDAHLRTDDFFDVERHPTIVFVSDRIVPRGDGWTMTGRLTIRGTTRAVEIPVRRRHEEPVIDAFGRPAIAFEGTTRVDRKAFGVHANARWNRILSGTGELAMSDDVDIQIRVLAMEAGE